MLKVRSFKAWTRLREAWEQLSQDYYFFPLAYKKTLEKYYNIDSGTDYANYIFAIGEIEY